MIEYYIFFLNLYSVHSSKMSSEQEQFEMREQARTRFMQAKKLADQEFQEMFNKERQEIRVLAQIQYKEAQERLHMAKNIVSQLNTQLSTAQTLYSKAFTNRNTTVLVQEMIKSRKERLTSGSVVLSEPDKTIENYMLSEESDNVQNLLNSMETQLSEFRTTIDTIEKGLTNAESSIAYYENLCKSYEKML